MPASEAQKKAMKVYYEKNKEKLQAKMQERKAWIRFYERHREDILNEQSARYYFNKEVRDNA